MRGQYQQRWRVLQHELFQRHVSGNGALSEMTPLAGLLRRLRNALRVLP